MPAFNKVFLIGNLTRNPELHKTGKGYACTDLRLAVSEKYRDRDGNSAERVCFVDITAWGKQAENCAEYLHKGSSVMIEGRLELNEWQDDQGGKHSRLRVVASSVQFLGGGKQGKSSRSAA